MIQTPEIERKYAQIKKKSTAWEISSDKSVYCFYLYIAFLQSTQDTRRE
jgi:hypothetical protein